MRNKAWIIGIIIISLYLSPFLIIDNVSLRNNALAAEYKDLSIDELFKESGSKWVETQINSWAKCSFEKPAISILEDVAKGAGEFFGLEDNLELSYNDYGNICKVHLKGNDQKGLKYDIIIARDKETYMTINIVNDRDFLDTEEIIGKVQDYFNSIGQDPQVSLTITGGFPGKLDTGQKKSIIEALIKKAKGRFIQTMEDDKLISVAGYSPILDTPPIKGINFQIASRYNGYRNITYLWIGTPIITIEY